MKAENETSTSFREMDEENSLLFQDKAFLDTLITPLGTIIVGRDKEIKQLSRYFHSFNQGLVVSFISVYGKSGTGKSATVGAVCKNFEQNGTISYRFVNLRKARTVFGCANTILHELGGPKLKSADGMNVVVDEIEGAIEAIMAKQQDEDDGRKRLFVLVLDEFDVLFHDKRGNPSDFLYSLLLIEENLRRKGRMTCIIAISNKFASRYSLDDRVISRIGSSEVYFPAYSKKEIVEILKDRAAKAFSQNIDPALVEYCAKLSSREHGDARRAIDVLRRAGELASSRNHEDVTQQQQDPLAPVIVIKNEDIDTALAELQKDGVINIINTLPFQLKLVIVTIVRLSYLTDEQWHSTSTLLTQYGTIHEKLFRDGVVKPVSRRRFAELLTELKNMCLIVSHTYSDGRHGYHAKYMLTEDAELIGKSTWQREAWHEVVKLKECREEFLCAKLFRKVTHDFERKEYHEPGDTLTYEMNDWNWRGEEKHVVSENQVYCDKCWQKVKDYLGK